MNLMREVAELGSAAADRMNAVKVPLTHGMGLWDLLKETFRQMNKDHLGAFAGNLAYNGLFSIFPLLLFVVSLLGVFHATSLMNTLIAHASGTMPSEAVTMLRTTTGSITRSHATGTFTVGAILSSLGALWGISGGFRAVMEAMNVMHEVPERRPLWKVYGLSILLSLVVAALLILAIVLVVGGPAIGGAIADRFGVGQVFLWAWNILQWPALLAFVFLAFAIVYFSAPDLEQRFRFVSPGAIVGISLWLAFSLLFSLFVNHFGSYDRTYGTLAGVAIFLFYIYYSAFMLLLGAEINQIVDERHPEPEAPAVRVQAPSK